LLLVKWPLHPALAAANAFAPPASSLLALRTVCSAAQATHLKHLSKKRFDSLGLSTQSQRAISEVLKYTLMSKVQEQSLPPIMAGQDVLARAKTGTGKTMGFLLPSIEKLHALGRSLDRRMISCLVLSPTRELASQIRDEAQKLCTFHPFEITCVVGGTNINTDKKRLAKATDILVATPGRLQDHITNSPGVKAKLQSLKVLILDEADQLLEMGFRPDIERILSHLPSSGRQTLLFSATVPEKVHQVSQLALKREHTFIDCIDPSEDSTNIQVAQSMLVVPFEERIITLVSMLQQAQTDPNHKIIVFFSTARECGFMAELCNIGLGFKILEIHSRKSQGHRTKTAEQFKTSRNAIMFSSDVSARGMDFPDVSHVVQIGITTKEQYIHRLGRTARAGKSGEGWIILCPFEERHMKRQLKDLPIKLVAPAPIPADTRGYVQQVMSQVCSHPQLAKSAEQCYQAWLGFHNSNLRVLGWDKRTLVEYANYYATFFGMREPPALEKRTVGKMGLKGVAGLRLK
jgi:ATP-dependent RNA helicase MSS116